MILDWKKFVLRSDIRNLPLEEQRRKFLKEQLYHDNLLSEQRQRQYEYYMSQINTKGGAGAGGGGFTGNASDGPISGATVISDVGTTTTDTLGNFTFPQTPSEEITVTGGTDSVTGVAFTGELKGFPQFKTVSPLTTLAFHLKEEDASLTADTAVDLLFASSSTLFGVELDVADKDVMLNKDYVAESILADNQSAVAAQSIATYLESVTEMVGSAVKSADSTNFTTNSAKVQGYKSIARQIQGTRGAKTEIEVEGLFDLVQRPDGQSFTRGVTGSLDITARRTVKSTLSSVRTQLGTLSRSELYNANYLTTQIQSVNRGVKQDYIRQVERLAVGASANFDSMDELMENQHSSLSQIESGRANETDANTSKRPAKELFQLGGMTYTMQEKGSDAVTLSFKRDPGQMFVAGPELRRGQFLNSDSGPFDPTVAATFPKAAPTIIATQVTASEGKVYEITLANHSFQIISFELKDAVKYLPTASGGYTYQNALPPKNPSDPISWQNSLIQPFTASIAANQTSTSATLVRKGLGGLETTIHDLEYNSSTNRYEYSTTLNPPKGIKTLLAHIADFTNQAQWTSTGLRAYYRFQINNTNTQHIASSGIYTISKFLGVRQTMDNILNRDGFRSLKTSYGGTGILISPTDPKNAPNGPFTVNIDGKLTIGTNFNFINNVLTFINSGITYTITYTTSTVDTHHIAGRGKYALSKLLNSGNQTLTIQPPKSIGGTNSLVFGEIGLFGISTEGIQVTHEPSSTTKFRIVVDGVTVSAEGGSSFSNNTMQFTILSAPGSNNKAAGTYTITYTT